MNVFIARIAASVASAVVVWLIGVLGLPVTEQEQANLIAQVTEAVSLLGLALWGILYAVLHKLISRKTNPADAAKNPELVASRTGADHP